MDNRYKMEKYIALLRGINVGGHKKILMADLKTLLSRNGLINITSYIQSGNIIFNILEDLPNSELELKIEAAIKNHYGFEVPTIVMRHSELKETIDQYPYVIHEDLKKHLITFSKGKIDSATKEKINTFNFNPDQFHVAPKAIYLFCHTAYHKSKMGNNFFEKQLKTSTTTRNWQTCLQLLELSKD